MELETFRKNKDLTYTQLAELLEMKRSTVYCMCKKVGDVTLRNAKEVMMKTSGVVAYDDLLPPATEVLKESAHE